MFIDKSTIYFSNGKQVCGKSFVLPSYPGPQLCDYLQVLRFPTSTILTAIIITEILLKMV